MGACVDDLVKMVDPDKSMMGPNGDRPRCHSVPSSRMSQTLGGPKLLERVPSILPWYAVATPSLGKINRSQVAGNWYKYIVVVIVGFQIRLIRSALHNKCSPLHGK